MIIEIAGPDDAQTVLALVEELLRELGAEGDEFAGVDRARLATAVTARLQRGPNAGRADTPGSLGAPSAAPQGGADLSASLGTVAAGSGADFVALLAREKGGEPVGILTLSVPFAIYAGGEYGVIDEMYVRPTWRGQGVGTALVDRAAAIARERGWRRLDVTTPVDDHLSGAARFYRRCGFEPTGAKLRLLVHR